MVGSWKVEGEGGEVYLIAYCVIVSQCETGESEFDGAAACWVNAILIGVDHKESSRVEIVQDQAASIDEA